MGRGAAAAGRRRSQGQALVLVVLSIVVILGMSSVAIDVGRLFTQQRFMQNAADAAALAGGKAIVLNATSSSATVATIKQAVRDVLAIDLAGSPVGTAAAVPADPPVFDGASTGPNLVNGIVVTDTAGAILSDSSGLSNASDVRVALKASVDFMLGRAIGVNAGNVSVRAHVKLDYGGNMMPIAARRYVGGFGPNSPVPAICPDADTPNMFFDLAATSETACQGRTDPLGPLGYNGRTPASPSDPGPTIALVGQGADANAGGVSFRGFVALDVRNFQSPTSRVYYNNVASGTNAETLKEMESAWVAKGYPGPGFPPVTSPPDPQDQLGIMDGNTAGKIVRDVGARFRVGDKIICALYDGTVRTIPAFWLSPASAIPALPASGATIANAGSIEVGNNKAFVDQIAVSIVQKPAWLTIGLSPSIVTPDYPHSVAIQLSNASATGVPEGTVGTIWVKGADTNFPDNQDAPDFYLPLPVRVGSSAVDFSWSPSVLQIVPDHWGDIVTFSITLSTDDPSNFADTNAVRVSLDPTATGAAAWPAVGYWFDNVQGQHETTVHMTTAGGSGSHRTYSGTFTLTVNTLQLGNEGTYSMPVDFSAVNASGGQVVHHMQLLRVLRNAEATNANYIDIIGFAAYRITSVDANTVWGQIVTPVAATPDDGKLRIALQPRLVPWSP